MRKTVRVAIIGGGNMGAGLLYHLAHAGWRDCLLIEKAELTSGATWHAAGLVSRMVAGHALGSIHDRAVDLYKTIEQETGQSVSWHGCGSLRIATSPAHLDWINHIRDAVLARDQEAEIIGPAEVARLNPLYDVEAAGVLAALFTPDDGHVDPAGACFAMAKGARQLGAEVWRHCRVTDVRLLASGEWQLITEKGEVVCEHLVNAAGYHARQVGALSGLDLPITSLQHHYVITDKVSAFAEMEHEIPVTRDDYFCGYIRREQDGALIGLYDKQDPQAVWLEGCPWESESELFAPRLDAIAPWLENCFQRCPSLAERGIKRIVNGGITYTPDGAMLLGPAPGLENYWLACGSTVGIAWGPGAGRALAQWMIEGSAEISTRAFDPRRFGIWADKDYAAARSREDYTLRQAMPFPQLQRQTWRNIRRSGAHDATTALGALFEEAGGWERPRLYGTAEEPLSWRRSSAFAQANTEALAVRDRVGLGDFSAFAKFEVSGPGAAGLLDRLAANRLPAKVGGVCLTSFLNRRGTIEGEATILRLAESRFYLVTGAPSERRLWDWLTLNRQSGEAAIDFKNRSEEIGILTLAGPEAGGLMAKLCDADFSAAAFPWLTGREITLAGIPLLAFRLSFTGSPAWELHAPMVRLGGLWDALWDAGGDAGLAAFGSKALDGLRMEKAYRGGHELTNDVSPLELDMMQLVDLDKAFIGREALLSRKARGLRSRIAYLEVDTRDAEVLGGEAVWQAGERIGAISSGAYGPKVAKSLAFAFLKPQAFERRAPLEVSLLGQQCPARLLPEAAYDPANRLLRG